MVDQEESFAPPGRFIAIVGVSVSVGAAALAIFHLYTALTFPLMHMVQRNIHVCGSLALLFGMSLMATSASGKAQRAANLLFIGLSIGIGVYVLLNYQRMLTQPWMSTGLDLALGATLLILIIEATRRSVGWALPILAITFFLYTLFGNYVPGRWGHRGFSLNQILERLFMTDNGIWGIAVGVSANVIAIFVVFGAVMSATGVTRALVDLAMIVSGRSRGGGAKVAVIASAFFGSVSGSAVANVAATGSVTIPMMKQLGYKPAFAGGVEASASTGGQILPPIMAAGAFLMAEIVGVPYSTIIAVCALPAILYFASVLAGVHFEALRSDLRPVAAHLVPDIRSTATIALYRIVIPFTLFGVLLASKFQPEKAIAFTLIVSVGIFLVESFLRRTLSVATPILWAALVEAGKQIVSVAVIVACAQIVISLVSYTGIGVKVAQAILSLSSGYLPVALFLTMLTTLLLGMGIPTTSAYLIGASAVMPALLALDVPLLHGHIFVFYFAVLSAVTPPVCTAVFVAAQIAKTDWINTAGISMRLCAAGFIIPFVFIFHPALLLEGTVAEIVVSSVTALIGAVVLAAVMFGYLLTPLNMVQRGLLGAASLAFIGPGIVPALAGLLILAGVLGFQIIGSRRGSSLDTSHLELK